MPVGLAIPRADELYSRVRHVIPPVEWATMIDDVQAIWQLKAEKKAIVLAHNYMTPEIFHTVADIVGDSLALAREARRVSAEIIVVAGVHFMAETAKLLNPNTTVLIPDPAAGCSLADSITAPDVHTLRRQHPDIPIITYVNTSAAVKAASDICCTSGNATRIVESVTAGMSRPRALLIPDRYLARNISAQTGIDILTYEGSCEVHERFTPGDLHRIRKEHPGIRILAHPECPPDVVDAADLAGSTAQMQNYVEEQRPRQVALITECSMSDNLAAANPDIQLIRPCNLCPHMKRNTLSTIRHALETGTHEIHLDPSVAEGARRAVSRMLDLS
ncbi:quinolinate synthetase [Austwickia chelonae]|uniref:Quinolinate synthase n=1 Tax=Austwickia chelonae NBRC 105200 TaxID=1184607 RepID=K6W6X1_9MICO|nr:quinolinate synthase NadA [Austwickia chelonae]GAB77572.1 quinolinate synthetase A [Austwickia chelonae NBRC 105200]SEW13188.1 quinolinate synthetase [Austwickia chelonae]